MTTRREAPGAYPLEGIPVLEGLDSLFVGVLKSDEGLETITVGVVEEVRGPPLPPLNKKVLALSRRVAQQLFEDLGNVLKGGSPRYAGLIYPDIPTSPIILPEPIV